MTIIHDQMPPEEQVRAHYDLGNEFFALFLDPSMTYSCAKFNTPDSTLAEAQQTKIDLSLSKCDLKPGLRLVDVGCGWGAVAMRAREVYKANIIGLTVSRNQWRYATERARGIDGVEFRCENWEDFSEPVDRVVSIGAFEHFGRQQYDAFFRKFRSLLAPDGVMMLHTITYGKPDTSFKFLRFIAFISREIFPGGDIPTPERVVDAARREGFELRHVEGLREHYARTLDAWAANLESNQHEATRLAGDEVYRKYMKYLTGCAGLFRGGQCNVHQFTLKVS